MSMFTVLRDALAVSRIKKLEKKLQKGPGRRAKLKADLTKTRDEYDALLATHKERTSV